jgi:hypothetical protein
VKGLYWMEDEVKPPHHHTLSISGYQRLPFLFHCLLPQCSLEKIFPSHKARRNFSPANLNTERQFVASEMNLLPFKGAFQPFTVYYSVSCFSIVSLLLLGLRLSPPPLTLTHSLTHTHTHTHTLSLSFLLLLSPE